MAAALDREKRLAARDELGRAAIDADSRLDIAVHRRAALMRASNFRVSRRFRRRDQEAVQLKLESEKVEGSRPRPLRRRPGRSFLP